MQVSVTLCRVNIPVQTKGCLCKYVYMLTDVLCVQAVMLYFSSFLIIHQLYYSLCLQSTYLLSTNELLHSMATRNYLCSVIFMLLLFFLWYMCTRSIIHPQCFDVVEHSQRFYLGTDLCDHRKVVS